MGCSSSNTRTVETPINNNGTQPVTERNEEKGILKDHDKEKAKAKASKDIKDKSNGGHDKKSINTPKRKKPATLIQNKDAIGKHYKIIEKIGSGSFGKVFKCLHIPTNQLRAMKVVKRETVNYQDDEQTFLKEIEVLSQLDHPNIIKIYEYFIDDSNYYVITEFASGGELYDQIYKIQYFNERNAAIIMEQLFSCVWYLHDCGIVHRDLKPENMLLETNNIGDLTIKLIDFGAANFFRKPDDSSGKLTLKVGTPYYIAPEVINKSYDNKCDVWSCGVIMFILLCGYPPFDGDDDNDIMASVKKGKYDFNSREWDFISKEAKLLIDKLLKYDPKKRISAEEALKDPWITKNIKEKKDLHTPDENNLSNNFSNLKKFNAKLKFQQACISFLVHQVSTNEMVKDLRKIFKSMDESGDGRLSYEELKKGFRKYFDSTISEEEFDNIIKNLDQDGNNYIGWDEFLSAVLETELILTEKNLKMAFEKYDEDKSGKLSAEELKKVLVSASGGKIDDHDDHLIKLLDQFDKNKDGEIDFEEFRQLMLKSNN